MKNPSSKFVLSLALAISLASTFPHARAELVSEEVAEDAITPEAASSALEDEVVIVKQKPRAAKRKVIVREVEELPEVQTVAAVQAAPAKKTAGAALDEGIQTKMDDVRNQFEQALLRQLDKIKITVDESEPAQTQAQLAAPVSTTIVQDSVVNTQGAPVSASGAQQTETYLSIDNAPAVAEQGGSDGASIAEAGEEDDGKLEGRVRVAPLAGFSSLGSDTYNIDSRHTVGVGVEVDIDSNLTAAVSYSYSQYDVSLGIANPYYNYFGPNFFAGNQRTLEYNQNVFDATLRYYLMSKKSRFRAFIGGGAGYNKGYLNYDQQSLNTFAADPNLVLSGELNDYEVTSFLGIIETGAEIQLSKSIAVGGSFKYANILSSRENRPINNNGFVMNAYGNAYQTEKQRAGGSIAKDNFYSILGTVKVAF